MQVKFENGFTVSAHEVDFGSLVWGEDGQYWQQSLKWGIEACDSMGRIYTREPFETEPEAREYVARLTMTPDWSPLVDEEWYYWRTMYGSPAWGVEDEISMMDDEERRYKVGY